MVGIRLLYLAISCCSFFCSSPASEACVDRLSSVWTNHFISSLLPSTSRQMSWVKTDNLEPCLLTWGNVNLICLKIANYAKCNRSVLTRAVQEHYFLVGFRWDRKLPQKWLIKVEPLRSNWNKTLQWPSQYLTQCDFCPVNWILKWRNWHNVIFAQYFEG